MIPAGVEIFIGLEPIDLRWGWDRLSGIVKERMGREVRSRALFVFFGKRRTILKLVFFDGTGLCLFQKRLDSALFRIPDRASPGASYIMVEERILDELLDGISTEAVPKKPSRRLSRTH